jgi:hypothetical protein
MLFGCATELPDKMRGGQMKRDPANMGASIGNERALV